MGWSCAASAGKVLRYISACIVERHGNQNQWETPKGKFFFETGRENADGAITGTVWRVHPAGVPFTSRGREYLYDNDRVTRAGGYRIEADGTITRFPHLPKDIRKAATV